MMRKRRSSLFVVNIGRRSCGPRVTPPDAIWDRRTKQIKSSKSVAKTYGPFPRCKWIEISKAHLQ